MKFDWADIDLQAKLAPIEGTEFVSWDEVSARVKHRRANPIPTIKTPFRKMDGEFEFTVGGYHLLGGYSGHGKSTLAVQCALHAAQEHKVAIASLEMTIEAVGELAYQIVAGTHRVDEIYEEKIDAWLKDRVMYYDRIDTIGPDHAYQMIIAAAEAGCRLVLLDCLFMIEGICADVEREQVFTQNLARIGKQWNIAILLVHHMRKPQGDEERIPSKASFIGSSHMVNASLSCLILWKDFETVEARQRGIGNVDESVPDYKLKIDKNRFFASHATYYLYEHKSRALCESSARKVKRLIES